MAAERYGTGLCLPFIPSAVTTAGSCYTRPYPYGCLASASRSRECKDFCGGQSFQEGQRTYRVVMKQDEVVATTTGTSKGRALDLGLVRLALVPSARSQPHV